MDFNEEQRFNFPFIIGLFIFLGLAAITGLGILMYSQITAGIFETEMLLAPAAVLFGMTVAYIVLFRARLETKVDAFGLTYKYFPHVRKPRLLAFNEIASWRITPYKNMIDSGGIGYRSNIFKKKVVFIMSPADVLELKLVNGKSISFSTGNAYLLSAVLKKYMPNKDLK